MTIYFDETATHAGKPMLHAIVIGVSEYGFLPPPDATGSPPAGTFGLRKLTTAARSAEDVAEWLVSHHDRLMVPLGTVRLCVAPPAPPGGGQLGQAVTLPRGAVGATRQDVADALNEWRGQLKPDDVALFYFAGHGVQRDREDMVLLCSDFARPNDGPLSRAIDFTHVRDGLGRNVTTATIARTQLYFIDACRERPTAFGKFEEMSVPDVWGVPQLQGKDDRRAPVYYATTAGALAYADPGVQTLFSRTLLRCLEREAATLDDDTGDWQITSRSLNEALGNRFRALAGVASDQECDSEHVVGEFVIRKLAEPPLCALQFQIDPGDAAATTAIHIRDLAADQQSVLPPPLQPHPFQHQLLGGYYEFRAVTPAAPPPKAKPRLIEPGRLLGPIKLKVSP